MEVGRHGWYSSFCDADRHMQGHTTQTKMLFQTRWGQHRQNRLMGNEGRKAGNTVKPLSEQQNHEELILQRDTNFPEF